MGSGECVGGLAEYIQRSPLAVAHPTPTLLAPMLQMFANRRATGVQLRAPRWGRPTRDPAPQCCPRPPVPLACLSRVPPRSCTVVGPSVPQSAPTEQRWARVHRRPARAQEPAGAQKQGADPSRVAGTARRACLWFRAARPVRRLHFGEAHTSRRHGLDRSIPPS